MHPSSDKTKLTSREQEVLRGIAAGMSTKAIAEHYGVSAGTISTHRHSILKKTGCRTSAQAVMKILITN